MNTSQIGAVYARVSTEEQTHGISLQQQTAQMLHYASVNGIEVPDAYRFAEQVSGYTNTREFYDEIRGLVAAKHITALIVYSSDRYTRDPVHGDIFRKELRLSGVTLHVVSEGGQVDITSPMGQFMRRQMDNFNWFWGQMIKQTAMEKKKAYTDASIPYVSGFACYGYERVGKRLDAHLVTVEDEAQTVQRIFSWYEQGHTVSQICELLRGVPTPGDRVRNPKRKRQPGEWNPSTIHKMLTDTTYRGVYYANRSVVVEDATGRKMRQKGKDPMPITVPALVSDEVWYRVQQKLTDNARGGGRSKTSKHEFLLTARSKCRHCGGSVSGNMASSGKAYYRCNRRYMHKTYTESGCDFMPVRVDTTDPLVWEVVKELLAHPDRVRAVLETGQEKQRTQGRAIEAQLLELDALCAEKESMLKGYSRAIAGEYARSNPNTHTIQALQVQCDDLTTSLEDIQKRRIPLLAQLDEKVISQRYIEDAVSYAAEIRDHLETASFELQREIIDRYDMRFEFELCDEFTAVVYLQWHIWEYDITVFRPGASHADLDNRNVSNPS
ncbi:recombinase family protein [Chloroflexales bacterium ZM16-3]|nr:recombinase family protein [Chloroflexales bacterium ZM16-3]